MSIRGGAADSKLQDNHYRLCKVILNLKNVASDHIQTPRSHARVNTPPRCELRNQTAPSLDPFPLTDHSSLSACFDGTVHSKASEMIDSGLVVDPAAPTSEKSLLVNSSVVKPGSSVLSSFAEGVPPAAYRHSFADLHYTHFISPLSRRKQRSGDTTQMKPGLLLCVVPFKWLIWERVFNRLIKFVFLCYALAWLLAKTSTETHRNVPVAASVVLAFYFLFTRLLLVDSGKESSSSPASRRYRRSSKTVRAEHMYRERRRDPPERDAWKKAVNAPIVESAWESFCGGIIQEWIYDSWYSMISPDREFPAEVRRLLNEAFAEVAQRAKKMDLRKVLIRDMCILFTEQLALYRASKSAMGIVNDQDVSAAKRDRAFQQEMRTEHTLHAAFYSSNGHYHVIRRMAEGIIEHVLCKEDIERPALRALGRELLATCVLRSILSYFTPYNANKLLLSLLTPSSDAGLSSDAQAKHVRGRSAFEHRVRTSVVLEELDSRQASHVWRHTKEQKPGLHASRSHPNLESMETRREIEESRAVDDRSEIGSDRSMDLKDMLEETDLLAGGKGESETTETGACLAPTSLPRPTAFPFDGAEEHEPVMHLIDSQISVESMSFVGHPRARVVAPEINTNGRRDYVVFKIRVADQTGEWTVTRRYRNFEALHKFLRDVPAYRELQPRLPPKTFMFQTRKTEVVEQRRIALDRYLQSILSSDVLAFSKHVWLFLSDQECRSFTPDVKVGLVTTIANNVDNARYRIKRTVESTFGEGVGGKMDLKKEYALRQLDSSESSSATGSVRIEEDLQNGVGSGRPRPQNGDRIVTTSGESSMRHNASLPEGMASVLTKPVTTSASESLSMDSAFGSAEWPLPSELKNSNLLSRFDYQDRDAIGRQVEKSTTRAMLLSRTETIRSIVDVTGVPYVVRPEGRVRGRAPDEETGGPEEEEDALDSEFDDYSGISVPLYEVADAIFNLPLQKFFRRQVFQVMRQVLSFLAGDAIDVYLNEKIKRLRSEHTLAWMIHLLQSALWPGGVWFTTNRSNDETATDACLEKDTYLTADDVEPDAIEMAESLETRLFRHAPAALVRLIGRDSYKRAMRDVYDLLQLPTFVRQIGYGVMEIMLLALFPELKELFAKIHKEARALPKQRR